MSITVTGWDLAKAREAGKGKPVKLIRADGSADLALMPNGQLRRLMAKPQGKAARKAHKAHRRYVRQLSTPISVSPPSSALSAPPREPSGS